MPEATEQSTAEILKRVRQIELRTRRRVTDSLTGAYHSIFKGQGMDFEEVREYVPGDDVRSIGAMSGLQSAGLRIPEDVGLIGRNDMEMARWNNIDLTTLRQPLPEIIDASVELVVSMLESPDSPPRSILFPAELVERGTLRRP